MINSEDIQNGANYCLGAATGYASYKYLPKYLKKPIRSYLLSTFNSIPKTENDIFYSSAVKAYESSFLNQPLNHTGKKRAEIVHVDTTNRKYIADEVKRRWLPSNKKALLNNIWFRRIVLDKYKMVDRHVNVTSMGKNAFCIPRLNDKTSLVVLNKDKMGFSTFHELGHAINAQSKGFKNILNRTRGLFALFVPLTLFAGLFTNKSNDENMESGKFKKFIKNNCGYIAAACMVPTLAEEGLASINGAKLAKGVLDKNMYKKLNKLNAKAWSSYLFSAILAGALVQFAVKLRDKIVESNLIQEIFN